jgi:gamma-glutamyltranspeptidase/glutathione hydrolase
LIAEALKHAFADRSRFLGDPDFVEVPTAHLIDKAYAAELDARVRPDGVLPLEAYGTSAPPGGAPRGGGTSHLSVIDADGNACALSTTINGYFGARIVAGSTGIILNDQMDDFNANPGQANAAGLRTGEKNAIAPGKRPLSSMTPTIVWDGERPWIVVGASGNARIISGTVQAIVDVVDFHADAATAVSAPRIHTQWLPAELTLEPDIPRDVADALTRRGHKIVGEDEPCKIQMVARPPGGSGLEAASDPRKRGAPAGY